MDIVRVDISMLATVESALLKIQLNITLQNVSDNIITAKQAISLLLVLALLSLTLFPIHYHFHHETVNTHANVESKHHGHEHEHGHSTGHVSEVHKSFVLIDSDHPEDSHTMEPVSDLKLKSATTPLVFAFLILSLLVVPLLSSRIYSRLLALNNLKLPCFHCYKSPPLRAPPAL